MSTAWTLRTQLRASFAAVILVFLLCAVAVGWLLKGQNESTTRLQSRGLPDVMAVDDMALAVSEVQQFLTDVGATRDPGAFEEAAASAQRFRKHVAGFLERHRSEGDLRTVEELTRLSVDFDAFWQIGERMARAYMADGVEAGNALMKGEGAEAGFDQRSEALLEHLAAFREPRIESARAAAADVNEIGARVQWILWGGIGAAVCIALGISSFMVRRIHLLLGGDPADAASLARHVGEGDLSHLDLQQAHLPSDSVLAQLKGMQASLAQVVRRVLDGSSSVASASAQIAAGNSDLASRTASQSAALQEAAASMAQLSQTVAHNTDDASEARRLADASCEVAAQTGVKVGGVIGTMEEVERASSRMSEIIAVIDQIAFQTNILALNASVEAARAGDQGRGFAVVAGEVRGLAGRSSSAAKDIRDLIQTNVSRVTQGMQQVREAGAAVDDVIDRIRTVSERIARIHGASQEQQRGIDMLSQAVGDMDDATQHNSALVEETAAAAAQLNEQAGRLLGAVQSFKLDPRPLPC